MAQRRKFSAEYKREAVAMLDAPGVRVGQIAADLGIGAAILGRWWRELRQKPEQAFVGNGRARDEVSDDPTVPPRISHPIDVPVFAGLA